jgi:4-hydroxy-4-methyl-2-oxoglutarate aldolase
MWLNRFTIGVPLDPRISTAILSDALDAAGRRGQVMDARIQPLVAGSRAWGRSATVEFGPTEDDAEEPYDEIIGVIDGLAAGTVLVVATGLSRRSGFWGELFSAAALGRGAIGVVCDGYVRDSPKIGALGFPVFATGTRPIDFRARMEVTASDSAVECGGVSVMPGDLVLADDDGVVVVPQEVESDVLERAAEKASRESTVLSELLAGASLASVWNRYRVL